MGRDGADVSDPLLQDDPTTRGFTTESSDTSSFLGRVGVVGVIKVSFIFAGTSDSIGASFSSQLEGNDGSVVSAVTTSVSVFVLFVKSYPSNTSCEVSPSLLSVLTIDRCDFEFEVKSIG